MMRVSGGIDRLDQGASDACAAHLGHRVEVL